VITRLRGAARRHRAFMSRPRARDYVYVFADGVHSTCASKRSALCLVILRVRQTARKSSSRSDGYRESTGLLAALLRDLHRACEHPRPRHRRRGARRLGLHFGDVSETREQRCWVHKIRERPRRTSGSRSSRCQEDARRDPRRRGPRSRRDAAKAFDAEFRAKWPKAADKIRDDLPELLASSTPRRTLST